VAELIAADKAMDAALALLGAGEVVAIPTETVYGLAGDATNGEAVARIFEAKGRPRFNPLIAHVADMAMAERIGVFDPLSRKLAEKFWPGPLTLVLPLRPGSGIHPLVTAGLDTIALRMPKGFGGTLIARLGRPLAAPSANSSGKISSTSGQAVASDLGARIPLVVDGGATPVGLESTIVKVEDGRVRLLRPGGVPAARSRRLSARHCCAADRQYRGAWNACLALCARCRRCGSMPARSVRERRCWVSAYQRAQGWQQRAKPSSICPKPVTCAKRRANLFAYLAGARPQRRAN
jgi:tRNA threonylcarbamoyl adenosine modification protein (Sua5/YciO/YrdC/YwlC family)